MANMFRLKKNVHGKAGITCDHQTYDNVRYRAKPPSNDLLKGLGKYQGLKDFEIMK